MSKERKLYTVPEFKEVCPMSVAGIYKAISEEKIPSVSIGRRKFIPSWYVEQILNTPSSM